MRFFDRRGLLNQEGDSAHSRVKAGDLITQQGERSSPQHYDVSITSVYGVIAGPC